MSSCCWEPARNLKLWNIVEDARVLSVQPDRSRLKICFPLFDVSVSQEISEASVTKCKGLVLFAHATLYSDLEAFSRDARSSLLHQPLVRRLSSSPQAQSDAIAKLVAKISYR